MLILSFFAILVFIVILKNRLAKGKGEAYLIGDDKKLAVVSRLSEWISNLTGSTEKAVEFEETNQSKNEAIIDDYISFSNKIQRRATLSATEKNIQEQLKKIVIDHTLFFKRVWSFFVFILLSVML